jgi:hypothetical protein
VPLRSSTQQNRLIFGIPEQSVHDLIRRIRHRQIPLVQAEMPPARESVDAMKSAARLEEVERQVADLEGQAAAARVDARVWLARQVLAWAGSLGTAFATGGLVAVNSGAQGIVALASLGTFAGGLVCRGMRMGSTEEAETHAVQADGLRKTIVGHEWELTQSVALDQPLLAEVDSLQAHQNRRDFRMHDNSRLRELVTSFADAHQTSASIDHPVFQALGPRPDDASEQCRIWDDAFVGALITEYHGNRQPAWQDVATYAARKMTKEAGFSIPE